MLLPVLLRPESRGFVELRSGSDPKAPPRIEPNYLFHPSDRRALVEGLKFCHRLASETSALRERGIRPFPPNPYCSEFPPFGDAYFDCVLGHLAQTLNHPVGTCAIGEVVDARLRVRGVGRLRVADASVMPRIVGGNTHAPVVMVGEKAAEMMVEEWGKGDSLKKMAEKQKDEL